MITILAPAYYSNWDKVKYLKQSAERNNVDIHWYGYGQPYPGWFNIQIVDLIEELKQVETSYVLYTDASDALFNTSVYLPEVAPTQDWIIMSQEHDGGLCAGGWFGPTKYAIECLELLKSFIPTESPDIMNPQERWREAAKTKLVHVIPDTLRAFFQVMDEPLVIVDGALYNPETKTFPMICHWAGGYTDPDFGKAALIEPFWRQLGY